MVVRRPGSTASAVPRELRGAQFKIVPIPGKGMGVVATSRIHRGERIMADPPLLVVTEGLTDKSLAALVARLPIPLRRAFFNLAQNTARFGEEKTSLGIVATNGIPYMHHGVRSGGIFPTACRINHSCVKCQRFGMGRETRAKTNQDTKVSPSPRGTPRDSRAVDVPKSRPR